MMTWGDFFSELEPLSKGPTIRAFRHRKKEVIYWRTCVLGEGQYGRVALYNAGSTPDNPFPEGVPRRFCLKTVCEDFSEACAIAALDTLARDAGASSVAGIVPAAVVHRVEDVYHVAMPLYDGTLAEVPERSADFAYWCTSSILKTIMTLWDAGLAYCDLKINNVLFHDGAVVLGDLGSIAPIGAQGIFTYPPQRAFGRESCADGIVESTEQDVVWTVGMLIVALSGGQDLANVAAACTISAHLCGVEVAIARAEKAVAAHADALEAQNTFASEKCARALRVALSAWKGCPDATLLRLKHALGIAPPRRARLCGVYSAMSTRLPATRSAAPPASVKTT